jgi:hypothetical protein
MIDPAKPGKLYTLSKEYEKVHKPNNCKRFLYRSWDNAIRLNALDGIWFYAGDILLFLERKYFMWDYDTYYVDLILFNNEKFFLAHESSSWFEEVKTDE